VFDGWNGIEKYYEGYLNGRKGMDFFEVNVRGEIVGQLVDRSIQPISGTDIRLTIHSELQEVMERSMIGKKGSVLVSNAKTGDILAFVSSPGISPEVFSGGTSHEEWNNIIKDSGKPLLDRNTSGQYPPGSIFKLITLFPLIEEKKILSNWETFCGGSYNFGDRIFNCWKEEGHGTVDMEKAVAQSCNIYFYQAIQSIPLEKWVETCRNFGFGKITQIDLPEEKKGLIPDRNYLNTQYGKWGWSKGAMLNLAVGQGEILVTPLQLLQFANLAATHGYTNKLHFHYGNKEATPFNKLFDQNLEISGQILTGCCLTTRRNR
jgi:penicillin-binding protein 2